MTLDEYNREFNDAVKDIENSIAKNMVYLGQDALAAIKERVIQEGVNAEGQKFTPYSTRPTLTNCSAMTTAACSRIAGSKKKRKELSWVTLERSGRKIRLFVLPGGYKQFRELHGRQTDHVSFYFNGRMWSNIGIVSNQGDHQNGTVILAAKTEEDARKLEGNTKRKGDILDLSLEEQNRLIERFNLETLNIFKEHNL